MNSYKIQFTLFTKMWPNKSLPELADFVAGLGVDGIELPVRPGYPVEPKNVVQGLPEAVKILGDRGLKIGSLATGATPQAIDACAANGVPIIRTGVGIPEDKMYLAAIEDCQREWDELVPRLERAGVIVGIQNHCDRCATHAMHLYHAVSKYDPRQIAAVWDPGHNGLQGEDIELALDVVWSHLCMVNLKNAYWKRMNGPEAKWAQWRPYWTAGRHGLSEWPKVAEELKRRGYEGDLCFSAEYSDEEQTDRLIVEDIAFAKEWFGPS